MKIHAYEIEVVPVITNLKEHLEMRVQELGVSFHICLDKQNKKCIQKTIELTTSIYEYNYKKKLVSCLDAPTLH